MNSTNGSRLLFHWGCDMNLKILWDKVSGKYGLLGGAVIVAAVALLLWFGVVDFDWVMGLINGS